MQWQKDARITHLRRCDVDWPMLARDLYAACRERRVTLRDVDREIGINATELTKLRHGKPLSASALATLIAWLYPDAVPRWVIVPGRTEAGSSP